jgi:hypothetical protein
MLGRDEISVQNVALFTTAPLMTMIICGDKYVIQTGSGAHPASYVRRALSPGVTRQGREADHSPPTSAKVKKIWIYTSISPYAFMV